MGSIDISVVIGSFNRKEFLKLTLESLRAEQSSTGLRAEIIVVDGGSDDGTLDWLFKQKDVITIVQHNRGNFRGKPIERKSWGYFMNLGFKCAQGKYVCMLSDDCLVVPGAIKNGVQLFEQRLAGGEKIGAVAFYWRNWPKQKSYRVGVVFNEKLFVNHGLYLNEALRDVGYAEEDALKFYFADVDLCLKMAENGYACIDSPSSFIEHYAHANMDVRNSNKKVAMDDKSFFDSKWRTKLPNIDDCQQRDWIEQDWVDPYQTAAQFKRAIPFMWKARWKIKNEFRVFSNIK